MLEASSRIFHTEVLDLFIHVSELVMRTVTMVELLE